MKKLFYLLAITVAISSVSYVKADSPRKVLYEKFTNASCPPCATQDPFYKAYINNPANKSIIIPIAFHVNFPGSDVINLINPDIPKFRREFYKITGVPAGLANGIKHLKTGNWYDGAPGDTNSIENTVKNYRGQMSPIDLTIVQYVVGQTLTADVIVNSSTAIQGKRLFIAFVERYFAHPQAGSNGQKYFEHVVRDMIVDGTRSASGKLLTIDANGSFNQSETFTVPAQADSSQIYVVAFVQDTITKEILQAGSSLIEAPSMIVTSNNKYSTVDRDAQTTKKITISNPSTSTVTVSIKVDDQNSSLHKDATVSLSTESLELNPMESKEIDVMVANGSSGGFSNLAVKISTVGAGISIPSTSSFGFLSKGTKYVVYTGFGGFVKDAYTGITENSKYINETALIPLMDGDEFFPTEKIFPAESFDVSVISLGGDPIALNGSLNYDVATLAKSILNAGKHVYVNSYVAMYYTFNPQGASQVGNPQSAMEFYSTMLGLNYTTNTNRNDGQRYTGFTVNGVMNDPIGKGKTIPANSFPVNEPTLRTIQGTPFTDVFTVNSTSSSIPIFYFNGIQSDVAGVRYSNPSNGARLVYTSFAIESLGSKALRDATLGDIIDWLVNGSPTSVSDNTNTSNVVVSPNPSSIFSTISFTSETNQSVTISLIDVQGKTVVTNEIATPTIGTNSLSILTSKIGNGTYSVVVKQGEKVSSSRLVIMN